MLTERQLNILNHIIQVFTVTGQPVGSKKLMEEGIKASSATIRNDMMALEELGLLEKTHSSSGRVPSMVGYRYYIDHLLKPSAVPEDEAKRIHQSLNRNFYAINEIVEQAAKILSQLTSYTAFSLGPEAKDRLLTGFRIVPLNQKQVMAIIVTDKGNVENQLFTIPESVTNEDFEKVVGIINDRLVGLPLLTVYHRLRTEIPMLLQKYFQSPEGIMDLFDNMLGHAFEDRVYVGGRMNLLDFNVLTDLDQFKSMYSLMRNNHELTQLLSPDEMSIEVKLGEELGNELLAGLSLVRATYEVPGHGKGTIALLGPTSMPYSKVFGLLNVFQKELALQLENYYRGMSSSNTSFE